MHWHSSCAVFFKSMYIGWISISVCVCTSDIEPFCAIEFKTPGVMQGCPFCVTDPDNRLYCNVPEHHHLVSSHDYDYHS